MASNSDLEDVNCVLECDAVFSKTGGMLSVMQNLIRACTTPRGSHPTNKSRFFNLKAFVNRSITGKDLLVISRLIETEASYDTRIQSAKASTRIRRNEFNQPVLEIFVTLTTKLQQGSFQAFLNVTTGELSYTL